MTTKKFYITTAIPYVNGSPHVGHSLEYFQADTIRRYHQLLGEETLLLSGADENALKNVQAAEKEGLPTQEYLDKYSKIWHDIYNDLGVPLDVFQRGSDQEKHWPGVQKLWNLCFDNGDIYKKTYKGYYCVGCESFKTEKELVDGICPEHQKKPELVDEENYFFKLSKYQQKLIDLIESGELRITPENKKSEMLSFIKSGLEDFSISRSVKRARGVGVPVPNDPNQVIYVWFDALNIYMTGIGYGWDEALWKKWWPADVHVIGKDINRFHTVYWPAMLLSAGIALPKCVFVHSFVIVGGLKISKSIGNGIHPKDLADEFGLEAVRYFMLSQIPTSEDGDFTNERFKEIYNANLANGLGNLVSRIAKLCENSGQEFPTVKEKKDFVDPAIVKHLEEFRFDKALEYIWEIIGKTDAFIEQTKPWSQKGDELTQTLKVLLDSINLISLNLRPFLPSTAEKILNQFEGPNIKAGEPLFPRLK
ncbi:MAG: methionine--tRNA ligase [Patescibacteria group bacterium]